MGLFRRAATTPTPDAGGLEPFIAHLRGRFITPENLPPVVAARSLIADTCAQIPLIATRANMVLDTDPPPLLRRPDPSEPRWMTISKIVNDLTGPGRAWAMVTARDASRRVNAIRVIPDREVTPEIDAFGTVVGATWTPPGASPRYLRAGREVFHVPNLTDRDTLGRSPLNAAAELFDGIAAAYETEIGFWMESGIPPFVIASRYQLSDEQTAELQDQWTAARARSGRPAIMTGELEIQELAGKAPDLFATAHETGIADTARVYRIPPVLLNARAGDSLTYSTTEGQFRAWLATGLSAYLMRIEGLFSDLLPRTVFVRADTSELLRTDTAARFTAYAQALGNVPWLTPDEVRAMEGRGPMNTTRPTATAPVAMIPGDPAA